VGTPSSGTSDITQISGSSIDNPSDFVILRDVRTTDPSVAVSWISRGTGKLQSLVLNADGSSEKLQVKPRSTDLQGNFDYNVGYTGVVDVGLSHRGYFLALLPNDGADLIKWNPGNENKVEATFHFEQGDKASRTTSIWGGYEGADAKQSWITRLFWSHSLQVSFLGTLYRLVKNLFAGGTAGKRQYVQYRSFRGIRLYRRNFPVQGP
jgi:hypothetical protein